MSGAEFFGALAAVLVGMLGNTYVMAVYLGRRIDRLEERLAAIEVLVARIDQRLQDHIDDPHAHEPAR